MIKIRGTEKLNNLIALRNDLRDKFVKAQLDTSLLYNPPLSMAKKEVRNAIYNWLYCIIGYGILLLALSKNFKNRYVILILIVLGIGVAYMFIKAMFAIRKKIKALHTFNDSNNEDDNLRSQTIQLTHEIAQYAVSIICLSEYYDELQIINDEQALIEKWKSLFYKYVESINDEYDNCATLEDFMDYYYHWERRVVEEK